MSDVKIYVNETSQQIYRGYMNIKLKDLAKELPFKLFKWLNYGAIKKEYDISEEMFSFDEIYEFTEWLKKNFKHVEKCWFEKYKLQKEYSCNYVVDLDSYPEDFLYFRYYKGTREFYFNKREMFLDTPDYPFEFTVVGKCLVDRWEVMANPLYDLHERDDTILTTNEKQEYLYDRRDDLPF